MGPQMVMREYFLRAGCEMFYIGHTCSLCSRSIVFVVSKIVVYAFLCKMEFLESFIPKILCWLKVGINMI